MNKDKLNYASTGVDIAAGDKAVEKIKGLVKSTFNKSVLAGIGQFGGFFKPDFNQYKSPVLISSTDGVGTKLKIAYMTGRHNTVGQDLANHCINDILVHGAKPLFFLDYIGVGKLKPDTVAEVVEGLTIACKAANMALIGGEVAELPGIYAPDEYDLAGTIVGVVDQDKIINGSAISEGDAIIGLGSDGLHTNGYSLARKIVFEIGGLKTDDHIDKIGVTVADALLQVHRCYLNPVMAILDKHKVNGMAHITGGGIRGNLVRILPDNMQANIHIGKWQIPTIFSFMQTIGNVTEADMFEAFNMGIGYMLVVSEHIADEVVEDLKRAGEQPYLIGKISGGEKDVILKG